MSIASPGYADYDIENRIFTSISNPKFKKGKKNMHERIVEIVRSVLEFISHTDIEETIIIIENVHMNAIKAKSNRGLMFLHAVICKELIDCGLNIKTIEPSSARAFLEVKPNNKAGGFDWVIENNFKGLETLNNYELHNDITDATILALNHNNPNLKEFGE